MSNQCLCVMAFLVLCPIIGSQGRIATINRDTMYLPDQADYLRVWSAYCETEDLVYWPPTRECYLESTRGPCFVGEVVLLDRQRLVPYCAPEQPQSDTSTSDLQSVETTPLPSEV